MLELVEPSVKYKEQYIKMIEYWKSSGEELSPWVLKEDYTNFENMVKDFNNMSKGINVRKVFVPNSTYWGYIAEEDKLVGAVNIRHYLNETLLKCWGNIGYGVRPDERRRGYAAKMLELSLAKCKELGLDKVLVGCYKENIASAKTIIKNGGILENEVIEEKSGKISQRYWIEIKY